jgi:hypothetical protein
MRSGRPAHGRRKISVLIAACPFALFMRISATCAARPSARPVCYSIRHTLNMRSLPHPSGLRKKREQPKDEDMPVGFGKELGNNNLSPAYRHGGA